MQCLWYLIFNVKNVKYPSGRGDNGIDDEEDDGVAEDKDDDDKEGEEIDNDEDESESQDEVADDSDSGSDNSEQEKGDTGVVHFAFSAPDAGYGMFWVCFVNTNFLQVLYVNI